MEFFLQVLLSCLNVPYIYGGQNPMTGMDCSALARWVLRSVGALPSGEFNAQMLYDYFSKNGSIGNTVKLGTLLFYGKSITEISHVAIAVSQYQLCEAGGAGSECTTIEIAKQKNACVRLRAIGHRTDLVASVHPNYSKIGMI
jgi:cell wall-associated NlpC family hydrolase